MARTPNNMQQIKPTPWCWSSLVEQHKGNVILTRRHKSYYFFLYYRYWYEKSARYSEVESNVRYDRQPNGEWSDTDHKNKQFFDRWCEWITLEGTSAFSCSGGEHNYILITTSSFLGHSTITWVLNYKNTLYQN